VCVYVYVYIFVCILLQSAQHNIFSNLAASACAEDRHYELTTDRDSSAEVEYRPLAAAQPKKVRVAAARKPAAESAARKPAAESSQTSLGRGMEVSKPAWNYNVRRKGAPPPPSGRDMAYEQRREQRLERQRKLLAQAAANERLVPGRRHPPDLDDRDVVVRPERGRQRRKDSPDRGQRAHVTVC